MTDANKQATNHWEVGNVKITRVIELEHVSFPPGFLFDGLTEDRVKSIGWLHPNYADLDGTTNAPCRHCQGRPKFWLTGLSLPLCGRV
jgi:hypothetical protein